MRDEQKARKELARSRAAKSEKLVAEFRERMLTYEAKILELEDTNKKAAITLGSRGGPGARAGYGASASETKAQATSATGTGARATTASG